MPASYDFKNIKFYRDFDGVENYYYTFWKTDDDDNIIDDSLVVSVANYTGAFRNNLFGANNFDNVFGESCTYNTFGDECYSNTFGNECYSNTFGDECHSNTFDTTKPYVRCHVCDFVNNTTFKFVEYSGYQQYEQYCGYNSSGVLKYWTPADFVN